GPTGLRAPTPRMTCRTRPDARAHAPPDDATAPRAGPRRKDAGPATRAWASTGTDHRLPPRHRLDRPSPGDNLGCPALPAPRRIPPPGARGSFRSAARRPG